MHLLFYDVHRGTAVNFYMFNSSNLAKAIRNVCKNGLRIDQLYKHKIKAKPKLKKTAKRTTSKTLLASSSSSPNTTKRKKGPGPVRTSFHFNTIQQKQKIKNRKLKAQKKLLKQKKQKTKKKSAIIKHIIFFILLIIF
ncbi:hypothetical protein RFI_36317 [Reticulomyxa filosa]|uniref:Uncharacterized protein n=1 Tax=Reticulomyxa filosa TaxID=46433 RepID=X6LGK8_RETFI|nr:hypothetical protein RFI_36317 [Reticulomyxa filosa]|eukprot:ETO01123.1 hypothetical protein RFI_36317 [Reticulomyxa filosa]